MSGYTEPCTVHAGEHTVYDCPGEVSPIGDTEAETVTPVTSWSPVNLAEVIASGVDPPVPEFGARMDGRSMIYPGRIHWIYGEPETGKTWLALSVVAELLEASMEVAYFDFEDDASTMLERLRRLGVADERVIANLRYIRPEGRLKDEDLAMLEADVLPGCALVVIDATTAAMSMDGLDLVKAVDTSTWLQALPASAARAGAAVVVLDHVVKSREDRGRWPIGSQAKLAVVTGAAYSLVTRLPIAPGRIGRVTVTVEKDRPGQVRRYAQGGKVWGDMMVDATGDLLTVRVEPSEARIEDGLSPSQRHVLEALPSDQLAGIGWLQIGDITADLGHPYKKPTILAACSVLVSLGRAGEQVVGGRGDKAFWRIGGED